ncbi:uncharacterized protein F5Z01DRAFT_307741 [Emericellopsis atlantica]|uniref:Uncharacterized protein n=1 Tax=Emericellopsis atlantica TaxID=2614577 RepID=A0A9P7ZTC3_9HYPO|nr:uncharacterized protein F5Z01DRAFT_307741 [Emericellopsis atlantica]KAG9257890.1 hypothetical protein F5Z01DRAFT_307741 [Emericellopsis atlantica]
MRVDQLLSQVCVMPDSPANVYDDAWYQDIVAVYHEIYASALHAFFESKWYYFMENGKMAFPRQPSLLQVMASFLTAAAQPDAGSQEKMAYMSCLEMKVVWELAKTAATAAPPNADNRRATILPSEANPVEAQHRFHVVDALLSGTVLPWNPLAPPLQDAQHHRVREFEFWYQLAEFLRSGVPGADEQKEADRRAEALQKMRNHLDGRENRDVLYSTAILREHGLQYPANAEGSHLNAYHAAEDNPRDKVMVAARFITGHTHVNGGTTNVARRLCDIAQRLYINPKANPPQVAQ